MPTIPDKRMRPKNPISFHTDTSTIAGMAQASSSSQPGPCIPKTARDVVDRAILRDSIDFQIMEAATQEVSTGIVGDTEGCYAGALAAEQIGHPQETPPSISGMYMMIYLRRCSHSTPRTRAGEMAL